VAERLVAAGTWPETEVPKIPQQGRIHSVRPFSFATKFV